MIRLVEVRPEDASRPLKQVLPGVFASGREMDVDDAFVRQHFPEGVANQIVAAKVGFVDFQIYEQLLPEEERAEQQEEKREDHGDIVRVQVQEDIPERSGLPGSPQPPPQSGAEATERPRPKGLRIRLGKPRSP